MGGQKRGPGFGGGVYLEGALRGLVAPLDPPVPAWLVLGCFWSLMDRGKERGIILEGPLVRVLEGSQRIKRSAHRDGGGMRERADVLADSRHMLPFQVAILTLWKFVHQLLLPCSERLAQQTYRAVTRAPSITYFIHRPRSYSEVRTYQRSPAHSGPRDFNLLDNEDVINSLFALLRLGLYEPTPSLIHDSGVTVSSESPPP